jgi:hypothetical protein
MKIIISERQYNLLLTEQPQVLTNALNGIKFIGGLVTLVEAITRAYNLASGKKMKEYLERVQSLTKQSLAGGRVDLTEEEMAIIREQSKIVLNGVANEYGYDNWNELKNERIRKVNELIKKGGT